MTRPESAIQPTSTLRRASRWRDYFTAQRSIVLGFALVEAAVLVWAMAYVILRGSAR